MTTQALRAASPLAWRQRLGEPAIAWSEREPRLYAFALGAVVGAVLGGRQPPAGAGLPLVGWHLQGGDLRPAHFIGIHAQQLIPALGAALVLVGARHARAGVWAGAVAWLLSWVWPVARGFGG